MGPEAEEFGPYVVYEQLGLGGMATVHRAETQGIAGFSKQVALKRMLPSVASDAALVKSFIREAQLASHLRHANVAQTYDLGKVGNTYFIAMELVPGRNLREILKHCAAIVGHMPLPIALNIVNQICDALDYAHDLCDETGQPLGIIHRDVSPSNIIVSEGGVVKLIDFGIAKASARSGMQTMSGTIKGKLSYMAPEYLMGSIDARADLFALGVIAHELLANRPLFQGKDDMDTLYRVKDMPILPPSRINPKVPPELDAIIMTALARNPEQRWQKANALRQALTTEIKRLGLVAHNTQVIEWIEWAFAQTSKPESEFDVASEPLISITTGTTELGRDVVPDEFSSSDGHATLIAPAKSRAYDAQSPAWKAAPSDTPTLRTPGSARPDDWNVATDMTTPASTAMDDALAASRTDPTKLVRNSARHVAAAPEADLVDTARDRSGKTLSPHVIPRRNTPVPRPATPRPTTTDDVDELIDTLPPRTSEPLAPRSNADARTMMLEPAPVAAPAAPPPAAVAAKPLVRTLPGPGAPDAMVSPVAPHSRPSINDLATRAERPSAAALLQTPAPVVPNPAASIVGTRVDVPRRRKAGNFLLAVLVLIAAGGAAAVVYFALPYLT